MKVVSAREFLGDRPVPRACALAGVVLVLGWASWVAGRHGILNPDRPRSARDIEALMYDFRLDTQDDRQILEYAKQQGGTELERFIQQRTDEEIFAHVDERIAEHRLFARREAEPPAGTRIDLPGFIAEEAPLLPEWARVGLPHVRTRTIAYEPGASCEMLCSTAQGAEKTYDEYIARLVAVRWSVESVQFDKVRRRGYFRADRGDAASLFVAVMEKDVFADDSTAIYWSIEGEFRGASKQP